MSLYRTMFGLNQSTFWILPMLGKHLDEYPRFRDCFVRKTQFEIHNCENKCHMDGLPVPTEINSNEEMENIYVFMRIGGDNRESYAKEIAELRAMPTYKEDFDDKMDNTYATFVFGVPEKWKKDWDYFKYADGASTKEFETLGIGITNEYKQELFRIFPNRKEEFEKILEENPV